MISILGQREVFHLLFLRQLNTTLKQGTYSLKGGVNMRFFFKSPRYSEDMDIDVRNIEVFKLRDIVMDIFSAKVLRTTLRAYQIDDLILPDTTSAKQTETTQRFKVHLVTTSGEDLFTKIEFSRRRFDEAVATETVSDELLKNYKLPPITVSHYLSDSAALQKVIALALRTKTQARDIFDLHILIPIAEKSVLKKADKAVIKKAVSNLLDINYSVFRDTVINYLSEENQRLYTPEIWDEIKLKVAEWLA